MCKLPRSFIHIAICVAGAAACLAVLGPGLVCTVHGLTDYMDLYAGGKLSFTADQYNVSRVLAVEAHATGFYSPTRLFMRLPFVGLLLWPLAQLPYAISSTLWELACLVALALFAALWPDDRKRLVSACCWSLPVWMTLAEGQDTAFLLLWLTLAALALQSKRPVAAGLMLSICAAKFHLFLLLPVWMIANRLWRVACGLSIGGSVLALLSFVAGGPSWPVRYYRLLANPANNPYAGIMPNLHSLFFGSAQGLWFEVIGSVVVAALVWSAVCKADLLSGLAIAVAGGVMVAPHDYMADCVLLLPLLVMLIGRCQSAWIHAPSLCLLTPVPYLALMANSLFVLLPVLLILTALALGPESVRVAIQPRSEQYPAGAVDSPA